MTPIKVFLETGKKKTFAGTIDWPGWCRSRWPPRYFVRRSAWYELDHAWETEDRILGPDLLKEQ